MIILKARKISLPVAMLFFLGMFSALFSRAPAIAGPHGYGAILVPTQPTVKAMRFGGRCPRGAHCKVGERPPAELNFRDRGLVTPAKDQSTCGSCTIFAAVAILESAFLKKKIPLDLSEQQVMNCIGFDICPVGQWTTDAMNELAALGTTLSTITPYTNQKNACGQPSAPWTNIGRPMKVEKVGVSSYADIKSALFQYGPVTAAFNVFADFDSYFNNPADGVYRYDGRSPYRGGHAVALVGYSDSRQAFLIKNSWGENQGDKGFGWIGYSEVMSAVRLGRAEGVVYAITDASLLLPKPSASAVMAVFGDE